MRNLFNFFKMDHSNDQNLLMPNETPNESAGNRWQVFLRGSFGDLLCLSNFLRSTT